MTLRLIIAMPVMQLLLFGYAINSNPRHLPEDVIATFESATRSVEHNRYQELAAKCTNTQDFERTFHEVEESSGFMRFLEVDALLAYDEDAEIVHVFVREFLDLEGMIQ